MLLNLITPAELHKLDSVDYIGLGMKVLGAVVLLVLGAWLAARLANVLQRALGRAHVDPTLTGFLRNLTYGVLIAFVLVMVLQQLGVPSAPLVAALGTAGLAVGLSLQGSLSNLASGVLLIVFRPFKIGDSVTVGGINGTVQGINLMHTQVQKSDGTMVVIPNAKVGGDAILNFSQLGRLRFELNVGIGYECSIDQAIAEVKALMDADERLMKTPAHVVWVNQLGDYAVNLQIRAFTNGNDFYVAQYDLLKAIKERFDEVGISMPGPQQQITVVNNPAPEAKP
ncbi:mechanosensitive ion channel family protein [Frateuria aurantia]|uniref:Small-conductance mechanosensitive channel n=1 Tax=Frateuria aurantia (strain ATCC 33424 / DSM 6220 / KCTC 2777 / LMG 1558 / NBRC 3245 / NCIMB 13370) TaxID=767434 RepID=H8KYZ9_FRAAD|nr:mechanosensitive ion channel domain-containing protein [Frateuria aurantia]AFC87029.1 small-conductance mechanosensitive channel [Frateuria aurantia DSM 6220]